MVGLKPTRPQRAMLEGIPVELRRSPRRRTRIGLAFDPGGYVIVEAPVDASTGEIRALIREHRRWLLGRLDKVGADNVGGANGLTACLSYTSGELMHYLGHPYELVVRPGRRDEVRIKQRRTGAQLGLFGRCHVRGQMCVTLRADEGLVRTGGFSDLRVRAVLTEWYRSRAEDIFATELEAWRRRLPWLRRVTPAWRHRFMRSQWGSCSRSGRISLNTHLAKTPPRLIQYVVLHELCHLQHYDHGRRFYALMARHMPDWRARRAELDHYLPVLLQD